MHNCVDAFHDICLAGWRDYTGPDDNTHNVCTLTLTGYQADLRATSHLHHTVFSLSAGIVSCEVADFRARSSLLPS